MSDKLPYPNGYDCSGCPYWDDINGCWADERSPLTCDEYYDHMFNDEEADWED